MSIVDHKRSTRLNMCIYCHDQWPCNTAEVLMDAADYIRNSPELRSLTDDHMRDCNAAADLIDPS